MGEGGACRGLRAPDLEAHDRLSGFRAAHKSIDERVWSSNRLEEEPDRPRARVLREEREEVR